MCVWANPEELADVILCDGSMHLLISVISGIGHMYGDAGLKQLILESGVFAAGSVQMILTVKDFDRASYVLKLVHEALSTRFIHNVAELVSGNRECHFRKYYLFTAAA